MRIIINEMKKIWNWKLLAVVGIVSVLFYTMFMSYYVEYYRYGNHQQVEDLFYAEELFTRYGATITSEELADYIVVERASLIAEAEVYIRTMPIFAEAGIYSFADYIALREIGINEELPEFEFDVINAFYDNRCEYVGFKLQSLENIERSINLSSNLPDSSGSFYHYLNDKEQKRIGKIIANGEHRFILSYWTYIYTGEYAKLFFILLILSVLILVSPLLVSDRHQKVHYLQYASKHGRRIMHGQLAATLLSSFALTTLMLLIFGGLFSTNGVHPFWNSKLSSAFNEGIYAVFNMTYGEWIVAMAILMYVLTLGVSVFAFVLSRFSQNMITLTMKLLPVFAAMVFLCIVMFSRSFSMFNAVYQLLRIFGAEAYVCGDIFVLGLTVVLFVTWREKRVDVT